MKCVSILLAGFGLLWLALQAQEPQAEGKKRAPAKAGKKMKARVRAGQAPAEWMPLTQRLSLEDPELHRDFPDLCVDAQGDVWMAYVEHDGREDVLKLARKEKDGLQEVAALSQPGILHQPALTADRQGGVWCVWGQVNGQDVMTLRARRWFEGKAGPEVLLAESEDAGSSFADAATGPGGRVWVAWQEIRPAASRIQVRSWSPETGEWGPAVQVSKSGGGHWEPRLACPEADAAWVVYDSSEGLEFNLRLARVSTAGDVQDRELLKTPEYEARATVAADGKGGLWIAAERGRRQWGLDARGHENETGFNAQKRLLLGRYDPGARTFQEIPVPERGRPTPAPDPSPGFAVNVPSVAVSGGRVWLSYRYFANALWRAAVIQYDPASGRWSEPLALPDSTQGQDRHQELVAAGAGRLWAVWPSDRRTDKLSGVSAVFAGELDVQAQPDLLPAEPDAGVARSPEPEPYFNEPTPPRPLDEHHTWTVGGKTYRLLWGDLHRHTDISNCRTGFDGCVLEAYRYAYDLAGLDFLGTSDHTDVGKIYSPYEWWHTQRQVDVFYAPGRFNSLYAYEREQPFPWGHRNIVFARRGGPLVYINRTYYRQSPWQAGLPVAAGIQPIQPAELWDILKRHGQPCAIISHTGATGMGTDWTRYADGIDGTYENTVEIFQGARVSYEGLGTPQPTVGLRAGEPYTPHKKAGKEHPMPPGVITDFDAGFSKKPGYNNGVYQKALEQGLRLGVFASSDHIATHTSFGGVYVEEVTREGIIAGFKARRTCAATDKIFVEFRSGDHLMGEVFETDESPVLSLHVQGTAPLKRITVVRNEQDHHVIELPSGSGPELAQEWTDEHPLPGENRYYLRIEQRDGNMAWSSPLWILRPGAE